MTLTLIRGIPGSGKSTLAKQLMQQASTPTTWYEADRFFVDSEGNYNWAPSQIGQAHAWCLEQTVKDLALGNDVIVSNTFTTQRELAPYFDAIHQYGENPTVICMQSNYGSIHNVPEESLAKMKARFMYDLSGMFKQFN